MTAVQSVLLTGGGSGIGGAAAVELAERGCQVLISGRRVHALESIASSSERIDMLAGDVTDSAHRASLAQRLADLPGPRAVFHAAGYFQAGKLDTLTSDDWRRSFETNVEARWALSQVCAPLLDDGRVLFIGSDAGMNPRPGAGAYSIAQAASETLRRTLQAEWSGSSRAVGSFKPGLVDTDMVRGFMELSADEFPAKLVYEDYISRGELASASVVAKFAAWLLLDVPSARFATTEWDIRDGEHWSRERQEMLKFLS